MLNKIAIFLILSFITQINAMEQKTPAHSMCYLKRMPLDVQDLIAYFLTCDDETEEEFITRTKNAEKLSLIPYYHYIPNYQIGYLNKELGAGNFDKTKIAFLYFFNGCMQRFATVTIIDSIKKESTTHQLEPRDYQCIALSPQASMIATIEKGRINAPFTPTYYFTPTRDIYDGYVMILYNLATKKDRIFYISKDVTPLSINFDRQGSNIIMHSNVLLGKKGKNGVLQKHRIFSLKITEDTKSNESLVQKIDEKPLQKYFAEKCVCKNIGYISTIIS
jgi:hypothetical protein